MRRSSITIRVEMEPG